MQRLLVEGVKLQGEEMRKKGGNGGMVENERRTETWSPALGFLLLLNTLDRPHSDYMSGVKNFESGLYYWVGGLRYR